MKVKPDPWSKVQLNPRLETPLAAQIRQQLAWLIASGDLPVGARLPGVRQAAARWGVNLHTVRSAYQKLAEQGLVELRQGAAGRVLPYDPGRLLVSGAQSPSHLIGLIVPNLDNPLYVQYLRGVEQAARPARCLLLVCDAHDEPEEALQFFRMLTEKGVDGVLIFSFGIGEQLPRQAQCGAGGGLPLVSVDWAGATGCSVSCDFEPGARQAVSHLLESGRRRIGLIAYAFDVPAVRQMRAGYEQALAEAGLALDPALVAPVDKFTMAAGEQAARALLRLPERPDALFAMSDLMAIGALQVIRAAGLRIPEDIALVGANDIPLAGLVDPPLTTLHQPAFEMGQAGMELLLELIGGGNERRQEGRSLVLPVELVIRKSS